MKYQNKQELMGINQFNLPKFAVFASGKIS